MSSPGVPTISHPAGFRFVRVHNRERGPIHFGTSGGWRWDDPDGHYGVCYGSHRLDGAFVEALVRNPADRRLTLARLQSRHQAELITSRPLHLAQLHGSGPMQLGARAVDVMADDYATCQAISRQIHAETALDGIEYLSKINHERCIALFDRAADAFAAVGPSVPIPIDVAEAILANHGGQLIWLDDEGSDPA